MFDFAAASQFEQSGSTSVEQQPSVFHSELSTIDRENSDMARVQQLRDKASKEGPLTGPEGWEFSAKNTFPGDLRGQELIVKLFKTNDLTPSEQGELQGKIEFKHDPRGQQLVQKSFVEPMSPAEEQELQALRQRKYGLVEVNANVAKPNVAIANNDLSNPDAVYLDQLKQKRESNPNEITNDEYMVLYAHQLYPDSPRLRELYTKNVLEQITDAELSELSQAEAEKRYPLDARAQSLYVRSRTADMLSPEEENEMALRATYQGSEELIQLSMTSHTRQLNASEQKRLGDLISEDYARKTFPDDPRMQDLMIRERTDQLSRAERLELTIGRATQEAEVYYGIGEERQKYVDDQIHALNESFAYEDRQTKIEKEQKKEPFNPFKPQAEDVAALWKPVQEANESRVSDYLSERAQEEYPDNPRARELYIKYASGRINDAELVELTNTEASTKFPFDVRAQDLYLRSHSATITEDETRELIIRQTYAGSEELIQLGLSVGEREFTAAETARREELMTELQARKTFPDDPRMQDMMIRDQKGQLSPAERLELTETRAVQEAPQLFETFEEQQSYIAWKVQEVKEALDLEEEQRKQAGKKPQ